MECSNLAGLLLCSTVSNNIICFVSVDKCASNTTIQVSVLVSFYNNIFFFWVGAERGYFCAGKLVYHYCLAASQNFTVFVILFQRSNNFLTLVFQILPMIISPNIGDAPVMFIHLFWITLYGTFIWIKTIVDLLLQLSYED